MTHLINYSAAPEAAAFAEIDIPTLEGIQAELKSATVTTEWGEDALAQDRNAVATAMQYLLRGETILMARDEDGVYFATAVMSPAGA